MNEPDSLDDAGDAFEALCAGQGAEQVVERLVRRGWSRDRAAELVRSLEPKVSDFLEAGSDAEPPPEPPPEEPMKSFRLHRGKPLEEFAQIAGAVAAWVLGAGLTALLAYSCSQM